MNRFPPYICVLDFKATCEADDRAYDHEIIEFSSTLLKYNETITNYETVNIFQRYCKPIKNPILTDFCQKLTGIRQEQVNHGVVFLDAWNDHRKRKLKSIQTNRSL